MELVGKIFETLGITQLALLQMVLVVTLVSILSVTMVRPILSTFQERKNRSDKPVRMAFILVDGEWTDELRAKLPQQLDLRY